MTGIHWERTRRSGFGLDWRDTTALELERQGAGAGRYVLRDDACMRQLILNLQTSQHLQLLSTRFVSSHNGLWLRNAHAKTLHTILALHYLAVFLFDDETFPPIQCSKYSFVIHVNTCQVDHLFSFLAGYIRAHIPTIYLRWLAYMYVGESTSHREPRHMYLLDLTSSQPT